MSAKGNALYYGNSGDFNINHLGPEEELISETLRATNMATQVPHPLQAWAPVKAFYSRVSSSLRRYLNPLRLHPILNSRGRFPKGQPWSNSTIRPCK